MRRMCFTILLISCNACGPGLLARAADNSKSHKPIVDYSEWPATTEKPFDVAANQLSACRPHAAAPELGPHKQPGLRMFVNPIAQDALSKGASVMPRGAVVVKEKHCDETNSPFAYAAMIKQAKGYDSEHGDWEYVYVDLRNKAGVERGRIQSCIRCHTGAARRDYLFRTHLQFATKPTGNGNRAPTTR